MTFLYLITEFECITLQKSGFPKDIATPKCPAPRFWVPLKISELTAQTTKGMSSEF